MEISEHRARKQVLSPKVSLDGETPRERLVGSLLKRLSERLTCVLHTCYFNTTARECHLLKMALTRGWLSHGALNATVDRVIKRCGRASYKEHLRNPILTPPDHVVSPSALGYAIKTGELSEKEIARLKFDRGDDAEVARTWGADLFMEAIRTVLNEPLPRSQYVIERVILEYEDSDECGEGEILSARITRRWMDNTSEETSFSKAWLY